MNNLNIKLCNEWNSNKTVNPITKRNIKVNASVYNNIEKNCDKFITITNRTTNAIREKKVPKDDKDICKQLLNNPNINPKTGRTIKENGPIYKNLLKLCDEKRNKTKSNSKTKSSSSLDISSKTKKLCALWTKNPTINPETGYKIKIEGPKYKYFKSLCLDINRKVKSPSPEIIKSPSFHSIKSSLLSKSSKKPSSKYLSLSSKSSKKPSSKYLSLDSNSKSNKPSRSKSNSFRSAISSISSMNDEELKNLFDKDKKLKQSVFTKLKKIDNIKKSSLSSSISSIKSSIVNPYFYQGDDYKPKKSSEETELEEEIFEEIKSSTSSSSKKSDNKDENKDDNKDDDTKKEGFLGKLFNIFGF